MKRIHLFCFAVLVFGKLVENFDAETKISKENIDDIKSENLSFGNEENPKESSEEDDSKSLNGESLDDRIGKSKESSKTDDEVIEREGEAINIDGLNVSQIKSLRESAEKYQFQTEVDRMMKLIINSLYKNKEIFLRELISNASDALDKIRFIYLTNRLDDFDNDDLVVRIKADKKKRTLHIIDTGIGMTKEELINNLGTIAKSGTNEFFNKVSASKDTSELSDLIGQFGVGFYSSFLVADKVTVISKSNADIQYIWESDASSFSVTPDPRGNTLKRGTEIILHLKEETNEYLEIDTLKTLVHKYSQFINFPIYLLTSTTKKVDVANQEQKNEEITNEESKNDEEVSIEDERERESMDKQVWDWELINKSKPIWNRKSGEISDDEYNEFFKSFSKETDDPITKTHFTAEGEVSFKAILYVPKKAPEDISNNIKKRDNIKLYVKRVFITDNFSDIMPNYLSFIKGIVDSDDLPLNVSRETLQQHKLLKVIKKKLIRKSLDMLKKLDEETYLKFWAEYSTSIKLGAMEDVANRNRLANLLRFWSSNNSEKKISLADYITRMLPKQDAIYFMAGNSLESVKKSPMVEALLKRQYEVLYLVDSVDEYTLQAIPEFEGKKFQNVAKEGFVLDNSDDVKESREKIAKKYEVLSTWLKNDMFKDYIDKVEISDRLTDSPCVLVATTYGWSGNMERIMKAQSYQRYDDSSDSYHSRQKKILEINPQHLLIKQLKNSLESSQNLNETRKLASILYDTAMLRSGYTLKDVNGFSKRVDAVIRTSMDIPIDEKTPDDDDFLEENLLEQNSESKSELPSNDQLKTISFATFRKLLQIEDDDELDENEGENEEIENEDTDDESNNDEREEEEDVNQIDEEVVEDNSEENDELADEETSDEQDTTSDYDSDLEEGEDDNKDESENEEEEEKESESEEPTKVSSKSFKKRKLHFTNVEEEDEEIIYKPTPNDHDCDGIPDDEDDDIDNDGLLDQTQDSDWDGDLNHFDDDDDNDGIPDVDDPDSNGDGIPDCREDSSDNKLRLRYKRKQKIIDTDMDGVPDDMDIDDDEDGIPDILEDSDDDNIPDILNKYKEFRDISELADILTAVGWKDHDCDGIPDQYDPDDDNDGYFDKKQDSDRDGILNEYDDDDDNDGIPDHEDPDSNGDGITDCVPKDSDGDGIPDHVDTDDDNDGVPDLKDPNHPLYNFFVDSDKDGIPDTLDNDDDNDGIPDNYDNDSDGDGESDLFPDKDKDGIPDHVDNDMDNDGIPDHMQDRDCDGIPDLIDPDDDNDGYYDNKQDSDNDGLLNEWDDDDDNDGIPDISDTDSNGDGLIDCRPRDSDGDGIPDHLDPDDDNDGIPDYLDPDSMAFLLYKKTQHMDALPASQARLEANTENTDLGDPGDKDCDGVPDDIDLDIDNDGKIDRTQDSDLDGDLNHVDEDDDNDGILDIHDPDANGDGIPDCRRDDFINYRLIKSRTGKIKRVLRIKKQTEEESAIENQKKDINLKLLKKRALEIGTSDKQVEEVKRRGKKKETTKPLKATTTKITTKAKLKTTTTAPTTAAPVTTTATQRPKKKVIKKTKKVTDKPKVKISIKTNKLPKVTLKVEKKKKVKTPKVETKKAVTKKSLKKKKFSEPQKVNKKSEAVTKRPTKVTNDHDCDGIPDNADSDLDNDGIDDDEQDSDKDGLVNSVDTDDDNDGIIDSEDPDANGDGIPDCKRRQLAKVVPVKEKKVKKVKSRKPLSIEEEEHNDVMEESRNVEQFGAVEMKETEVPRLDTIIITEVREKSEDATEDTDKISTGDNKEKVDEVKDRDDDDEGNAEYSQQTIQPNQESAESTKDFIEHPDIPVLKKAENDDVTAQSTSSDAIDEIQIEMVTSEDKSFDNVIYTEDLNNLSSDEPENNGSTSNDIEKELLDMKMHCKAKENCDTTETSESTNNADIPVHVEDHSLFYTTIKSFLKTMENLFGSEA